MSSEQECSLPYPRIYSLDQIEKATGSMRLSSESFFDTDLISAISDGFKKLSAGKFNTCPIQTMGAPPMAPFRGSVTDSFDYAAQVCVKSGYLTNADHFVVKVAAGGYPLPKNTGLVQLYSQRTGKLEGLLMDDGLLTELRTAAAGAVAASVLAPNKVEKIGIIGTGIQARFQLRFLRHMTPCRHVLIWGRNSENVKEMVEECNVKRWIAESASSPEEILLACDIIVTTTSAREPILGCGSGTREKKKGGQHITCIGADAPGKIELDPALVASADLLVADSRLQTAERGEFQRAISDELVSLSSIVELGELIPRRDLHRRSTEDESDDRLTIFDSSGVAMQDCVVAQIVYDKLLAIESKPKDI